MEKIYTENKDRIMVSPDEATKSKVRFDRLVELTLKILGLVTLPLEYLMHYSPWIALVMTWDQHRDKMQCNDMIYAALHFMKWSRFPTKEGLLRGTPHEKDMCELLATFQEELRSPGFGHIEILKVDRYKLCHFTVEISTRADTKPTLKSVSNCHQLFLKARFLLLTHPFDEMADEMGDCAVFKEAVESLIPNASSWDDTQWCNERYILSQINRRYHTHYLKAPIQLNGLVILAIKAKQGIAAPDIPLADIQELPIAFSSSSGPKTPSSSSRAYIMQPIVWPSIMSSSQKDEPVRSCIPKNLVLPH